MLDLIFVGQDAAQTYDNLLTLTLKREEASLMVAPASVWFECTLVQNSSVLPKGSTDIYDPSFHEILYFWTFDDAANATPTTALNMPDIWKDTNKGYGKRVAHAFNDAGTYTVTCYAYEPATRRFGSQTITATVADADSYFPGPRTIVYAPNGTGGLSIPSSANVQATWAGAIAARDTFGKNQTARILIAPNVEITFEGTAQINADRWSNARIGALDPAAANRPRLRSVNQPLVGVNGCIFRDNDKNCDEIVFYGVDFQGEWESAAEKGRSTRPFFINSGQHLADKKAFLMHRCYMNGFNSCTGPANPAPDTAYYLMWSDTQITNWRDYGMIVGYFQRLADGYVAIVGCSVAQHENALSGGSKSDIHNRHGAVRDFGSRHMFISVCDLFSRNGWSAGGTVAGLARPADQGAIRINTTGLEGASAYVERVAAEGGIAMQEQNSTNIDVPGNYVIEKVLQVAGSMAYQKTPLGADYGGATIRNYLGIKLNLPEATDENSNQLQDFIEMENEDGSASNDLARMAVYNATCIDLRTDAYARDKTIELLATDVVVPFSVVVVENNVFHQPNRTSVSNPTGELVNLAPLLAGFSPRHKGPRYNFMPQRGTFGAAVPSGSGTLVIPYSAITDQAMNLKYVNTGTPTNQAYWQANAGTDIRHELQVGSSKSYHAQHGEFTVAFGATQVTLTNVSGTEWPAGENWVLHLDRTSRLPGFDPRYDSRGQSMAITVPRPASTGGQAAYDDFALGERPATGNAMGAI